MRFLQNSILLLAIGISSCSEIGQRPKPAQLARMPQPKIEKVDSSRAVHTITEYYKSDDGVRKQTKIYNTCGQQILLLGYDDNGNCDSKDTFSYDSRGDKVSKIWYLHGKFISKKIYKYDDKHQVIRSEEFLTTLPDSTWNIINTYKYDCKGQVVEEVVNQGRMSTRTVRRFNDRGKVIFYQENFRHEKPHNTRVYVYDSKDSLVLTKNVLPNGDTEYMKSDRFKICEHGIINTRREITYY